MYKDKDKQKQANRKAQARFKAKAKGITNKPLSGITLPKETDLGNTLTTTQTVGAVIPKTKALPACVPEPVSSRYARGEPEYMQTIDRLLAHSLDQLKAEAVWIPVWRYTVGIV